MNVMGIVPFCFYYALGILFSRAKSKSYSSLLPPLTGGIYDIHFNFSYMHVLYMILNGVRFDSI